MNSSENEDTEKIKRMADLFRSGATMLAETCPACHSPLFDVGGKIYCAGCDRNVVILKPGESEEALYVQEEFGDMGAQITAKIREIIFKISEEKDLDKLKALFSCLKIALECLEKVKNVT